MSIFQFADGDGNILSDLLFETLFPNNISNDKELQLISEDYDILRSITLTPYKLADDLIPSSMIEACKNAKDYMELTANQLIYSPTLTLAENDPFFIRCVTPDYAVDGNFMAGLRAQATCIFKSMPGFEAWSTIYSVDIIGSTDGDKTNFPVEITMAHTAAMRNDFGDIRFIAEDRTTLLSYDLASFSSGTSATFVVKIPSLPISPAVTRIFVIAGNAAATTTSNPAATYGIYDDFGDGVIAPAWTQSKPCGTITEAGGVLQFTAPNCDWFGGTLESAPIIYQPMGGDYTIETQLGTLTSSGANYHTGLMIHRDRDNGYVFGYYMATNKLKLEGIIANAGNQGLSSVITAAPEKLRIRKIGTTLYFEYLVAGVWTLLVSLTQGFIPVNVGLVAKSWQSSSVTFSYQYFLAKATTVHPPTVGALTLFGTVGNPVVVTENLTLNGVVYTDSPMNPPLPVPNKVIAYIGTGSYEGISSFRISKRKSDGTSTFDVTINNGEYTVIYTGQNILFSVTEGELVKKLYMGIIQDVDDVDEAAGIINLSGRGISLPLLNEKFELECGGSALLYRTTNQLLDLIFEDTGIEIGAGEDIDVGNIPNNTTIYGGWCGNFSTKKEAIDSLMALVGELKGKIVNWFIDKNGQFRTFYSNTKSGELGITITKDNPRLISRQISENSENIINDLSGTAGQNGDNNCTLTRHREHKRLV